MGIFEVTSPLNSRILVLDDESGVVDVIVAQLSANGYSCVGETSPRAAVASLESKSFDLLLTDLKMPEMSGMEVVRKAKAIDPDIAIIVLTGLGDVTNAIESMRAGADDYILKPFNLNEIAVSIGRALEKRHLVIENREYQDGLEKRVDAATSDLEKVNRELRQTKEYLESLLDSTLDGIVSTDRQNLIEFANVGAERMFGYLPGELIGKSMALLYGGGSSEVGFIRRKLSESRQLPNYETMLKRKDGTMFPGNISLSLVHDADGQFRSVLAICKDFTEQKRLEAELKEMSIKDSLTGLYNQRHFYDRLESELERARRQRHPLSLVLFDIDQFKTYNDCHGHLEGDKVLQAAGLAVMESTREHVDIGFRYGGDEFTVILPEADESQALQIAERIRTSFEARHFDSLTLSIGLMQFRDGHSLRGFIRFTDAMMYESKRKGGNMVTVYKEGQVLEFDEEADQS